MISNMGMWRLTIRTRGNACRPEPQSAVKLDDTAQTPYNIKLSISTSTRHHALTRKPYIVR